MCGLWCDAAAHTELVVAVLWQNGEFSYYPARIGARVVAAYVEKQRRLANNLAPTKAPVTSVPAEVGAVWTTPDGAKKADGTRTERLHAGRFFVNPHAPSGRLLLQSLLSLPRSWACAAAAKDRNPLMPMRRFLSFRDFDWGLLGVILLLCTVSVLEIYSATLHTKFWVFIRGRFCGSVAAWWRCSSFPAWTITGCWTLCRGLMASSWWR